MSDPLGCEYGHYDWYGVAPDGHARYQRVIPALGTGFDVESARLETFDFDGRGWVELVTHQVRVNAASFGDASLLEREVATAVRQEGFELGPAPDRLRRLLVAPAAEGGARLPEAVLLPEPAKELDGASFAAMLADPVLTHLPYIEASRPASVLVRVAGVGGRPALSAYLVGGFYGSPSEAANERKLVRQARVDLGAWDAMLGVGTDLAGTAVIGRIKPSFDEQHMVFVEDVAAIDGRWLTHLPYGERSAIVGELLMVLPPLDQWAPATPAEGPVALELAGAVDFARFREVGAPLGAPALDVRILR